MTNSQVPKIILNPDDTISLMVNVSGFAAGTPVEISGQATQANGAVATFYTVQTMPEHDDGEDAAIWVESIVVAQPKKFDAGFPVTVIARAAEAWITTLEAVQPDSVTGPRTAGPQGSAHKGAWKSNYFGSALFPSTAAVPAATGSTSTGSTSTATWPAASLRHGKWWDRVKNDPLDEVMEGRFTRLFPDLPGARFDQADLEKLAVAMTAPPEDEPDQEAGLDPEENRGLPAAYTYLGQFIDHDLTFDPISYLRERLNPSQLRALVDFRTPRFDLDSLYGRGPADQPYLYQEDGVRLLPGEPMPGNPFDQGAVQLPRLNGRAVIGDPRNDENRIVGQLHAIFLRFHNAVVDYLGGPKTVGFAAARQQVQWHYQWILVNEFLPAIMQREAYRCVFPGPGHPAPTIPRLRENNLGLMPVEFSVAAYRFGHSMVRPRYRLNQAIERPIFSGTPSDTGDADDLGGFRPIPASWAIDWRYFIDLGSATGDGAPVAPQLSYKIDTSLVNPLGHLPPQVAQDPSSLPLRNLMRGSVFQLPSGQRVAEALGVPPLADDELMIGKAIAGSAKQPITEVAAGFAGNAPLWAYVLAEAPAASRKNAAPGLAENDIPIKLGPVGGRLVAEVFASLLLGDAASYLHADPAFAPIAGFTRAGKFGLAELITAVLGR